MMKHDNAFRTVNSLLGDLPAPERLQRLLEFAEQQACDIMRRSGRLTPVFFAASATKLDAYVAPPIRDMADVNELAAVARLICATQHVTAAVLATEAWALESTDGLPLNPHSLPSQSPEHSEYVFLSGEAWGEIYQQKLLPILRDKRQRFSCLGTTRVLPPERIKGPLANLLPQDPISDEVRVFARSILAAKGYDRINLLSEE